MLFIIWLHHTFHIWLSDNAFIWQFNEINWHFSFSRQTEVSSPTIDIQDVDAESLESVAECHMQDTGTQVPYTRSTFATDVSECLQCEQRCITQEHVNPSTNDEHSNATGNVGNDDFFAVSLPLCLVITNCQVLIVNYLFSAQPWLCYSFIILDHSTCFSSFIFLWLRVNSFIFRW